MFIKRMWMWLLKTIKTMCTCKSKCNCGCDSNSSITEGLNGYNAFTYTSAIFAIPPADNTTPVTVNVKSDRPNSGEFTQPGQMLLINGNYLRVVSSTENTIVVVNPETSTLYTTNQPAGTLVPINSKVSPTGEQGPQGLSPVLPPIFNSGTVFFNIRNFAYPSAGFGQIEFVSIEDLLVNDKDSVEIETVLRYNDASTTTINTYRFTVDGTIIQEFSASQLFSATDFKFMIHKAVVTRLDQTTVNVRSSIRASDASGILNPVSNEEQFEYTTITVLDAANLPLRFTLRNNNTSLETQSLVQVKYIPNIPV